MCVINPLGDSKMNKILLTITAVAGMAFAATTFAADSTTNEVETKSKVETSTDGAYKENTSTSTEEKTPAGTMKSSTKVKAKVDNEGNGKVMKTTKSVNDPKGLFNKTTSKTVDTKKVKNGEVVETTHKKKIDGKTVEDTKATVDTDK
jgi:hypothetical protein